VFPHEIIFEPHADVHSLFSNAEPSDPFNYLKNLKSVPADSNLYNVYGYDEPAAKGGNKILIGTLTLQGSMVTSKFGDTDIFVRHQILNQDVELRPDWKDYYASYKLGGKCPYQVKLMEMGLY